MSALVEESADYPEKVAAYLAKTGRRRLPWGWIVTGPASGCMTKTSREIQDRYERGDVAIALVVALGVTEEMIDRLADLRGAAGAGATGAELVVALEEMRAFPPEFESPPESEPGAAAP